MSEHRISLAWKRQTPDFAYDTYDRTHTVMFEGGQTIQASAAAAYLGKADYANPEELLAASLSSCHMLTFLAIAAKPRRPASFPVLKPRLSSTRTPKVLWR